MLYLMQKEQASRHQQMAAQLEQELIEFRRTTVDKPVHSKLLTDCCKMENYLRFEVSTSIRALLTRSPHCNFNNE
jgi:hypothetical protein